MSLTHAFNSADRVIRQLDPGLRSDLDACCRDIRRAEERLNAAAATALTRCLGACRGICCRNLQLDAVIAAADFVYILASQPALHGRMADCLGREAPLFTCDCVFLEDGTGPCIFPPHLRPEVCITSFCRTEPALEAECAAVRRSFRRLGRLVRFRRVLPVCRRLTGALAGRGNAREDREPAQTL